MLVTERAGRLRLVGRDGALSEPLAGVPQVRTGGQAACSTSR
jgi:glucose/arabinose dehydrogenase